MLKSAFYLRFDNSISAAPRDPVTRLTMDFDQTSTVPFPTQSKPAIQYP
jgi:hypothetical protein